MKIKIKGIKIFKSKMFLDNRGYFQEIYKKNKVNNKELIFHCLSNSKKNVLRGIHGDQKTWKLITCLYGEFQLIVVNNDLQSNEYKKWESFHLSFENKILSFF